MTNRPWRTCGGRLLAALWLATALLHGVAPRAANATDVSRPQARGTPEWLRDGVIYEIFPRDFSAAGNFAGITAQLDRLRHLGVNVLWLMPIHPIGELHRKGSIGSPYAVRDYRAINGDYGTDTDLHTLVAEAHERGLRVIIDIVANHTSWDSVLMNQPDFYRHDADGHIVPPQPDWEDVAQLNYDNPRLRRYMIDTLADWLREFDLDGFRCDAAAHLPTEFWEQARTELMRIKPDLGLLAEADRPDLLLNAFDIDYAWSTYRTLVAVIDGRQPASALRRSWSQSLRRYPAGALHMRFSDNHDQRRAIARFGEPAALAASALMFTLDGVPMLYNGMEVGDTAESAAPALFEKLPIFWANDQLRPQFLRFYETIIAFRRQHSALIRGTVEWLRNSDERRVVTFLRRDGKETLLVAINLSSQPFQGRVSGSLPSLHEITPIAVATAANRDALEDSSVDAKRRAHLPTLTLAAWEYRVYAK